MFGDLKNNNSLSASSCNGRCKRLCLVRMIEHHPLMCIVGRAARLGAAADAHVDTTRPGNNAVAFGLKMRASFSLWAICLRLPPDPHEQRGCLSEVPTTIRDDCSSRAQWSRQ